jgi:hypothetical protein
MRKITLPSHFLILLTVLLLASLACGSATAAPLQTTEAPAQENGATTEDSQQPTPPAQPYEQTSEIYTHKSNAFSLPLLKNWEVEENETGVVFRYPGDDISVKITAYNIGTDYTLNNLATFALALDTLNYGSKDNYQGLNYTPTEATRSIKTDKRYSIDNNYYYVVSDYHQEGKAVFAVELFAHSYNWQIFSDKFDSFVSTVQYQGKMAENLPIQEIKLETITYKAPEDVFTIEIPSAWTHTFDDSYPHTTIDSFVSTDQLASAQVISYIDTFTWNQVYAGKTALQLLNNLYTKGAGDIKILADTPQPDGKRERLDWVSTKGGYSGITYFEAHGKQLILLTMIYANNYEYFYKPVMEQMLETYSTP